MPINIEEALQRIEAGESQREIAASFGVAVSTLNEHLNKPENAERSARARSISAESWLDRGLAYVLDENTDPARAHASWLRNAPAARLSATLRIARAVRPNSLAQTVGRWHSRLSSA